MKDPEAAPFFIGFLPAPDLLRPFLLAIGGALIVLFCGVAWVIGATQDDPGPGAFQFGYGRQNVTGVLELHPYPILRVTEGTEHIPAGR
ncbi:MAG: hypothetical protein AAF317_14630, partial [Pseudomonadota bacterium]